MDSTSKEGTDTMAGQWTSVYFFKLLFEKLVKLPDTETICRGMQARLGNVEALQKDVPRQSGKLQAYLLHEHQVHYEKDHMSLPSQVMIYGAEEFDRSIFDPVIRSQCWTCGDVDELLSRCNYELMASNFLAASLPQMELYGVLAAYADSLLELFPECIALYWPHSQKLMPREAFEKSQWKRPELHFLDGGLNVRFFRIMGTEDMVVDTTGLAAMGLPDLQCHFHTLDHNEVIRNINNLAAYLFEYGDIINDGDTVEGIHPGNKWKCRREDALIQPSRLVLDINVGSCAAGGRD